MTGGALTTEAVRMGIYLPSPSMHHSYIAMVTEIIRRNHPELHFY